MQILSSFHARIIREYSRFLKKGMFEIVKFGVKCCLILKNRTIVDLPFSYLPFTIYLGIWSQN